MIDHILITESTSRPFTCSRYILRWNRLIPINSFNLCFLLFWYLESLEMMVKLFLPSLLRDEPFCPTNSTIAWILSCTKPGNLKSNFHTKNILNFSSHLSLLYITLAQSDSSCDSETIKNALKRLLSQFWSSWPRRWHRKETI